MTEPENTRKTVVSRRRFRWKRLVLLLIGLALSWAAWVVGNSCLDRILAERELRAAVAEIDASDPGWRLEEIESQRLVIPEEQNSAIKVLAARTLMPGKSVKEELRTLPEEKNDNPRLWESGSTLASELEKLSPEIQLSKQQTDGLRGHLDQAAQALAEARKIARLDSGRHPNQWREEPLATDLSHIHMCIRVAYLLCFDATLHAQEGDVREALTSCRAEFNVGRSIGDEPCVISQLVRIACISMAEKSLERILAQGEPDDDALAAMQTMLQQEDDLTPELLALTLRGERAIVHRTCGYMEANADRLLYGHSSSGQPSLSDRIHGYWSTTVWMRIHARTIRRSTEFSEYAKLPYAVRRACPWEFHAGSSDRKETIAQLHVQAVYKSVDAFTIKRAKLRCLFVMVAAERYRQAFGFWPESLDDIVDIGLLADTVLDPCDDRPLRLKLTDTGLIVYSAGPDGEDNGGNIDPDYLKPGTDIGFRLWDPDKRRQLPP